MKKLPRKNKQWAEEAYTALQKSIRLFHEEYPNPSEEEKLDLILYAVPCASLNRGINDKAKLSEANELVLTNLKQDFAAKDSDEPTDHSILFLLAYLDAHVAFGSINQQKAEDIMDCLSENYQISVDL